MGIVDITNAIARQEDSAWNPQTLSYSSFNPNSLAQKNNNPGNLRYNKAHPEYTPGAIGVGAGGFAKYASIDDGLQDLERQVNIDAGRDLDVGQFINKYAPSSENQTSTYLSNIMSWLRLSSPNVKLTDIINGGGQDGSEESPEIDASINPFGDDSGSVNWGLVLGIGVVGLVLFAKFK
jgi:hypothetical protein